MTLTTPSHLLTENPLQYQDKEHVYDIGSFDQGPLPPSVYTDVIHMTRPSPSRYLHTVSNQKLDGGKAWERG